MVRKGEGSSLGEYVALDLPSAPALTRDPPANCGSFRLYLTQSGLFGGKALSESVDTSPCLTSAVPDGQVIPVPFPPQPSSKKSLSAREFLEEPECKSPVRAEAGSKSGCPEIACGSKASGPPRQQPTVQNCGSRLKSQWPCCVRGSPRPTTLHTMQSHYVLGRCANFLSRTDAQPPEHCPGWTLYLHGYRASNPSSLL